VPRILLVEDDEMNADMLRRRLTRRGFEITHAPDGELAVQLARELLPDLILMDVSLPKMDGWSATKILKADEKTQGIPIIALTAHALAADRATSVEVGCDDFDTKPVDLKRLIDKMNQLL